MTFAAIKQRAWTAIGRFIYVAGPDGPPIIVASIDETEETNPSTANAIAEHVADLHNANLTKRTITESGAALASARRD